MINMLSKNEIPDTLVGCNALATVNLANNKLTKFPIVLTQLLRLEIVDLAGNSIQTLPDEVSYKKIFKISIICRSLLCVQPN